ncbi:MAG: tryptophan 7-halogenase [Sphingomonas sp.]
MTVPGERAIEHVAVVGGGLTGWSAAAALKRRLPELTVTLLAEAATAPGLIDHLPGALPSIHDFHADLGLGDGDAVHRTGAAYRLGTLMTGWATDRPDYVHGYGAHGPALPGGSFHLHWVRAQYDGAAPPFDQLAAGAALARAGRFATPVASSQDPFGRYGYGLTIDPPDYLAMLRAFAEHVGVSVDHRGVAGVAPTERGWVDRIVLDDGDTVRADLYLDCTGSAARLCAALDDEWEDWRRWLPCDRIIVASVPLRDAPSPLDRASAWAAGWRWSATGARSASEGIVYHADATTDDNARQMLSGATTGPMAFAAGTRPQPWRGNCVAIGEAATVIEPLGWSALHLVHSAIDRLITMFPDRELSGVEAADYNRQAHAEAERVRDFVLLHYAASSRPEPFWPQWREATLPASLEHSLALFRDRGRLPFYEHETFDRDEWLAVLIGQGVLPRRIDPLVRSYPAADAARHIAAWHAAIAAGVAARPPLAAFLGDPRQARPQ